MILTISGKSYKSVARGFAGKEKRNEMKLPGGKAATREYVKHRGAISEMFKKY